MHLFFALVLAMIPTVATADNAGCPLSIVGVVQYGDHTEIDVTNDAKTDAYATRFTLLTRPYETGTKDFQTVVRNGHWLIPAGQTRLVPVDVIPMGIEVLGKMEVRC